MQHDTRTGGAVNTDLRQLLPQLLSERLLGALGLSQHHQQVVAPEVRRRLPPPRGGLVDRLRRAQAPPVAARIGGMASPTQRQRPCRCSAVGEGRPMRHNLGSLWCRGHANSRSPWQGRGRQPTHGAALQVVGVSSKFAGREAAVIHAVISAAAVKCACLAWTPRRPHESWRQRLRFTAPVSAVCRAAWNSRCDRL